MAFEKPYPILLSLLLALLSHSVAAQASKNLPWGSVLTAGENGSFWPSSSDDYAFGFKQIEKTNGFLLAIWFNKIPENTIVWSAKNDIGDALVVSKGSKVEIKSDGWLQLLDPKGSQIWSGGNSGSGDVGYAQMLDTGNFVLFGQRSQPLWQSFDHPTDTILPGQVLNSPSEIVSRYSQNNFSTGKFQLRLQEDGNLVLRTTHSPSTAANLPYWNSAALGDGFSLVFNQTGSIFVQSSNKSIAAKLSLNAPSTQDFYHRAIIDYDGVFKHYIYPKGNSTSAGSWPMSWSVYSNIPEDICSNITDRQGSGACGFNSYCTFDSGMKSCLCPYGYIFIDPNDVMKGCKQNFAPQSCNGTSSEAHLFNFTEMEQINFPGPDYDYFTPVGEDWCRQACLDDCHCALVVFRDGECWKVSLPLRNGKNVSSFGGKALIKIRKDNYSPLNPEIIYVKNDRSKLIIIGSTLLGSSVFLNLLLSVAVCVVVYWFGHSNHKKPEVGSVKPRMNLRNFTYKELMEGTNGFAEELGRGAFSTVYKGVLPDIPGNLVAVKKLKMVNENEKEFEAEVSAIGQTHHRNLVQLLGFCNEGEHRLLVYEFMSKGTLASFLFEGERPSWYQRVQIAIGTAKGLLYLHEECRSQIIHCDIKPQNVLLDDSYTAKISDFGLAKLLMIDQTVTTTAIRGTKGYVAAEWFKNKPITMKVDVYSFGVLLVELICCRKSFDVNVEDENKMVLIDWAYDCLHHWRLDLLVEEDKEAQIDIKSFGEYLKIGIWCVQEDPSARPTMKQVVQMLEGFMDVPNPPDLPSFANEC
ncbi:G-type lectin S-receptor-like serine/threonine-protein kinase LECRK2 [Neltuma alba]|uniref:G-type lectin S-receptor-like serine/threonine-protein kinase LECRK2 n=1 Tax=Neltuma alba TaxID=207710 RepID=UPI0010A40A78|nr:G-type lectin S-receptor-like serine/threonine-protein kinase LECRK2 [Prosopis alba]